MTARALGKVIKPIFFSKDFPSLELPKPLKNVQAIADLERVGDVEKNIQKLLYPPAAYVIRYLNEVNIYCILKTSVDIGISILYNTKSVNVSFTELGRCTYKTNIYYVYSIFLCNENFSIETILRKNT